ncbi:hypothetical protein BD310DRAFT_969594 [Dichomitus squalens]|uniref:Uncharacterized protein n=1 Tax=Dichomitus squalens TaxID=114155 RepID=A0A4Q9PKV2_9APHY|nr:hypothetical protein BD310DRAFT_969594 [Dichomitus squalens]
MVAFTTPSTLLFLCAVVGGAIVPILMPHSSHSSSPQCPALPVAQRRLASLDGDTAPQHRAQGSRSAPLVQTVLHRHAAQVRRHPPPDGVGVGLVVFLGADHLDFALHVALDLSFGVHFDGPVGLDFGDVFDFGLGVHVHVDHDGVRCDASRSRDHQSIRMAHKRMAEL